MAWARKSAAGVCFQPQPEYLRLYPDPIGTTLEKWTWLASYVGRNWCVCDLRSNCTRPSNLWPSLKMAKCPTGSSLNVSCPFASTCISRVPQPAPGIGALCFAVPNSQASLPELLWFSVASPLKALTLTSRITSFSSTWRKRNCPGSTSRPLASLDTYYWQ